MTDFALCTLFLSCMHIFPLNYEVDEVKGVVSFPAWCRKLNENGT